MNECKQFQGICEHQCVNTIGSFECRCPGGGILNPDQRTCSGKDIQQTLFNPGIIVDLEAIFEIMHTTRAVVKIRPEKNSGLYGI